MADSEAWSDCAKVTLTEQQAVNVDLEFYTLTETIEITDGDRPIETQPVLCGGRITRVRPQEDTTVALKLYPVHAFNPTSDGTAQAIDDLFYDTETIIEAAKQVNVSNASGTRKKFRVAVLWTDDTTATNAVGAMAKTSLAYRWVCRNAYITGVSRSFGADGQLLSIDVTLTVPAQTKAGSANIMAQSTTSDATADLAALTDYTTDTSGFTTAFDT